MKRLELLDPLGRSFVELVRRRAGIDDPEVLFAAGLACWAPSRGHACVHLAELEPHLGAEEPLELPDAAAWAAKLAAHPQLVRTPGSSGTTPLVLDGQRLYLDRTWRYEVAIADALTTRSSSLTGLSATDAKALTARIWSTDDDQRRAAEVALRRRLAVITGGPGTGKTTTVARLVAVANQAAKEAGAPLRVLLLAPTGKAQERLGQTVREKLTDPKWVPAELCPDALPESRTLHSGLGSLGGRGRRFRHGPGHPLPADLVVLDEASMVDLGMMARLLAAVPPDARLVLLGDPDQLQAVDYGSVLGDVCRATGPVSASRVELQTRYRYADAGRIRDLDDAIREERAADALALLDDPTVSDVRRVPAGKGREPLRGLLKARVESVWKDVRHATDPAAALRAQQRLGLLCANREGRLGVSGLNEAVEGWLQAAKLVNPREEWYDGRPVMVLRNDKVVGLRNGQLGLILDGRVWFDPENPRSFRPGELPEHTTCFAMTVHKSQGSEFDEVVVVLPRKPTPLTTRQLLYTAVTRAKERVTVVGSKDVVEHALKTPATRMSGLAARLS